MSTDASGKEGLGAWYQNDVWSRPLREEEQGLPIDVLELQAIVEALLRWQEDFRGKCVLWWCDNQVVVHALNSGRGHAKLVKGMETIFLLERELGAQFCWVYIPTDLNT